MNVTLMERLDFQLFFDVITIVIDALLRVLWHFLYTLVIELSRYIANHTLIDFRDPFAQLANCHMPICMSMHELCDPLLHVFDIHTLWPIDFA